MDVSVVIPTYNRAGLLGRTIPALMAQRTEGYEYEVIFVSNGATDHTESVLREAAERHPGKLRYFVIAPTGGPSAPRNRGIREATGNVVIILDDDVLPDPELVARHADFHRRHAEATAAAIGEVYVPPEMLDDPMSLFHLFPYDEVRRLEKLCYLHFWTCNVSVKREFMLRGGMFNEKFLYYEDMLCGHRLETNGMQLHFVPEARGQHLHQLKPEGVPSKGLFTGLWLHRFLAEVPDPVAMMRFGVIAPELPPAVRMRRRVSRAVFRMADNPLTAAALRLAGAGGKRRNRFSDIYYRMVFRRNLLAGFRQAEQEAKRKRAEAGTAGAEWVNRGES
ncbi:MAG: glycosyltransferase family A protein [Bryobacteraceae bacterium]|nr:glycosyltransferase family A protein [Bryobacteraceae bacterium]